MLGGGHSLEQDIVVDLATNNSVSHDLPDEPESTNPRARFSADWHKQPLAHPSLGQIHEEDEESACSEHTEYLHCVYSRRGTPDTDLPRERTAKARARASFDGRSTSYSTGQPRGEGQVNVDSTGKGDGPARPYRFARICHVCSARTTARLYCHKCGHPLCPSCTYEVAENTPEAHRAFLAMVGKARDADESSKTSPPEHKRTAQNNGPESPQQKPVTKQGAVSDHPWMVADREVRRSIAAEMESEVSNDPDGGTEVLPPQDESTTSSERRPSTVETVKTYPPQLHKRKSSGTIPKVRAASPPNWLKHPSKEASSIDGRLQLTNARSRLRGSEPYEPAPVVRPERSLIDLRGKLKPTAMQPPREIKRAEIPPFQLRKERTISPSVKALEARNQVSIPPPKYGTQPTAEVVRRASRLFRTDSDQRSMTVEVSNSPTSPEEVRKEDPPPTSEPEPEIDLSPHLELEAPLHGPEKGPEAMPDTYPESEPEAEPEPRPESTAQRTSLELHRPEPIMPPNHNCDWKEQYNALAAEMLELKAEMASRDGKGGGGGGDDEGDATPGDDELGLEGLTIVMHLKGKEDLVINTDLREASGA